jgi:colanic acid biosynthesis glycosyl transferase WcaI
MARILIWSPNYAPELIGIAPLVTDAADWLASRGHRVDVVAAMPNYPERQIHAEYSGVLWRSEQRRDVLVHRSWLRVRPAETFVDKALYELTFTALSLPSFVRKIRGLDVLVCVVPSLLAARCSSLVVQAFRRGRRPRLVLWVQDLVVAGAASVEGSGWGVKHALELARRAERSAVEAADCVVVCSPGFRDYLVERGLPDPRIVTIHNWVNVHEISPIPTTANDRTRFLYTGNLGYSQGFEALLEAARIAGPDIEVQLVGDGNAAANLVHLAAGLENVVIQRSVPRDKYAEVLASADVGLVIQRRVSAGANFPSKIASYLASGRPILASIAPETPAARVLRASGGALLVPPEEPQSLAVAMERLHVDRQLREQLGRAGREYAVRNLDRQLILPRLEQAFLG